jgi:hypothetical protein
VRPPRRVRPLPSIHPCTLCAIAPRYTHAQRFTCESQRGASILTVTQDCNLSRTISCNSWQR